MKEYLEDGIEDEFDRVAGPLFAAARRSGDVDERMLRRVANRLRGRPAAKQGTSRALLAVAIVLLAGAAIAQLSGRAPATPAPEPRMDLEVRKSFPLGRVTKIRPAPIQPVSRGRALIPRVEIGPATIEPQVSEVSPPEPSRGAALPLDAARPGASLWREPKLEYVPRPIREFAAPDQGALLPANAPGTPAVSAFGRSADFPRREGR
ncbi:MAG: hypothetical protein HYV07_10215 [Deltaproteobacteria bacterium]|nr:hypothetical protein [Deltaproteobacteria bacterium]